MPTTFPQINPNALILRRATNTGMYDTSNIAYNANNAATPNNPVGVAAGHSATPPAKYPQPNLLMYFVGIFLGAVFVIIVGWAVTKLVGAKVKRNKERNARRAKDAAVKF